MKVVIVEDEFLAAQRLENMIHTYDPTIQILSRLESVADSVTWFRENDLPDLVFMDIHLEDGLSFQIFDQVIISAPLIFTTAYDEYAIKAFKLKSIDYLLKPIVQDDLAGAINKYKEWGGGNVQVIDLRDLNKLLSTTTRTFRERFSVTVGERIKSIGVSDISYFFSTSGITFAVMKTKNQYSLDLSLDQLSRVLDPKLFFRINRQYLIHLQSIANIHIFPKSRLKVDLIPPSSGEGIFVSLDKVVEFKKWVDGLANEE